GGRCAAAGPDRRGSSAAATTTGGRGRRWDQPLAPRLARDRRGHRDFPRGEQQRGNQQPRLTARGSVSRSGMEERGVMKKLFVARIAIGLMSVAAFPGVALAQAGWTPGAEVVGQPISVTTNGVTNMVTLSPGGQAAI